MSTKPSPMVNLTYGSKCLLFYWLSLPRKNSWPPAHLGLYLNFGLYDGDSLESTIFNIRTVEVRSGNIWTFYLLIYIYGAHYYFYTHLFIYLCLCNWNQKNKTLLASMYNTHSNLIYHIYRYLLSCCMQCMRTILVKYR